MNRMIIQASDEHRRSENEIKYNRKGASSTRASQGKTIFSSRGFDFFSFISNSAELLCLLSPHNSL